MIIGEEEEEKFGHFYAMVVTADIVTSIAVLIPLIRLDIE